MTILTCFSLGLGVRQIVKLIAIKLRHLEPRVLAEGPMILGGGVVDGGFEDGCGVHTGEELGGAAHQ